MRRISTSLILIALALLSLTLTAPSYAIPLNPYSPIPNQVTHTMTVRIALAGISQIDQDRLLSNLEPQIQPSIQTSHNPQGYSTAGDYALSYGTQFKMKYDIATVPDETLSSMKNFLSSIATVQKVPKSLQQRTYWSADPDPSSYAILDALKTEDWINSHISEFGGIPDNGYLIILANVSDISTLYHYYSITYPNLDKISTRTADSSNAGDSQQVDWMFSWGGHYRFYFLDLSAGDPKLDYSRVGHVPIQSFGIRPWWGEVRYNAQSITDAVADYISDTVRNLFLPGYVYAPTFSTNYQIVIHVFDETGSVTSANVGDYLSTALIQKAFQKLIPYATWTTTVTTHKLSDDSGLSNALADSVLYSSGSGVYYDYRQTYSYMQSHIQQYAPTTQNTVVLPVFEFIFKGTGRFATIWEERIGSGPGASVGDGEGPEGLALGDMAMMGASQISVKQGLTQGTIHELGHLMGLMHPHSFGYENDYVASAMSYLTFEYEFSQFDADAIQRAHADSLFSEVQATIQETGNVTLHDQAQALLNQARSGYNNAASGYDRKDYANAIKSLVNIPRLLDQAFNAEVKDVQRRLGETYTPELSTTFLQQANLMLTSANQDKSKGDLASAFQGLEVANAWIDNADYAKSQAQTSAFTQLPIVLLIGLGIGLASSFLIFRRTSSKRNGLIRAVALSGLSEAMSDGHAFNGGSPFTGRLAQPDSDLTGSSIAQNHRSLLIGAVSLVICAMIALLGAFEEYFTVGEFFALHDIAHHEVIEVTVLAFGIGVFATSVAATMTQLKPSRNLIQTPIQAPIPLPSPHAHRTTEPFHKPQTDQQRIPIAPSQQ